MTLRERVLECRSAFAAVVLTSGVVNVLYLTASLFMMQVYDRVLGSQSVPTLIALSLFAVCAYLFQGLLDLLRQRMISRMAEHVDASAAPDICRALLDPARLRATGPNDAKPQESLQPFRDLDAVRSFAVGGGMLAILDAPWMPIYFGLLFLLHPVLGWTCVAGGVGLLLLAMMAELTVRAPARTAAASLSERNRLAETAQRGAEVVQAMGMRSAMVAHWSLTHDKYLERQRSAADRSGGLAALSRTLRYVFQSAILGLSAYLAVRGDISAGSIVTASILAARAMAPIDQAIVHWRGFLAARLAWRHIGHLLDDARPRPRPLTLPAPKRELRLDHAFVGAAGRAAAIVSNVDLTIAAGSALGVVGPSASGKSTLAGALVGVRPCLRGRILLDGAPLDQWDPEELGRHVGYLPQDVQLFDGTIGQNIGRFLPGALAADIVKAAQAADFHRHILDLPNGYDTRIGSGGCFLSSGQRQRLGLARALFGEPFLVVLDEPNANLDAEGERAVGNAIAEVRARGGIAVVVAHRPSAFQAVDFVLALRAGEVAAFGPRDDILKKAPPMGAIRVVRLDEGQTTPGDPRRRVVEPTRAS